MHFPERLKFGDDAHDDVTAAAGKPAQYMNQSIFSMIAAAGSKANFHARFEDESSDSGDNDDTTRASAEVATHNANVSPEPLGGKPQEPTVRRAMDDEKLVGHRYPRITLPKLNLRTLRERQYMSQSSYLPAGPHASSLQSSKQATPRDAPVMSQMLAAQADLSPMIEKTEGQQVAIPPDVLVNPKNPDTLATRLMRIFGLEAPEEVLSGQ